ncbi:MAG: T9SS type A sorting domain-containing protein [Bacteroidales bacterium]|nr:T9SS type A sorting domain-containing protein [Bacteroidales bacterium]
MKIKLLILTLLFSLVGIVAAQERREFTMEFNEFALTPVVVNNQTFYQIDMGQMFVNNSSLGQAALPCYNEFIEYFKGNDIYFKETVIEKDTIYINDSILIAPLQKSKIKGDRPLSFYFDKAYYSSDMFQGDNQVSIHKIGTLKDKDITILKIAPLRYNPVKNIIERIKKIKVEVFFQNEGNQISALVPKTNTNRPFKMIILTDEAFKENLSEFVKWKTMQGFDITLLYTSQTGKTTQEIKSYLQELYDNSTELNPSTDYLLIVGDTDIIPAFKGKYKIENYPAHYTDLYYAEYTSDILPDAFYGRISASDTQTLNNIMDKIIKYEKYTLSSFSFLKNSLLVAGKETGDNAPTFTNGQMNYAKQYLLNLTDTIVYYNPSSAEESNRKSIREKLNTGNSWINYTGHGTYMGWQNPPFRVKDVDTALNNTEKYGVFINNCCHTGKYDEKICFTESLLQAKNKGAVACIGASDYTLWDEDYYWALGSKSINLNPIYTSKALGIYDRFFHTQGEDYSNQYLTMGQIMQAGNLGVTQSLSDYTNHYWEMYNLQGDPTLIPYVGLPSVFEDILPDTLILGKKNLEFTSVPYTYIALSSNDTLITALQSDSNGYVNIDLADITEEKTVYVVMTNQFYKPLIDSIVFVAPQSPFVTLKNIIITDKSTGDAAENLEEGEEYSISFDIFNSGTQDIQTTNNHVELKSDNNLLITQNSFFFSEINSKETQHISSAFDFKVKNGVKNFETSQLDFSIYKESEKIGEKKIVKEIFAPQIAISSTVMSRLEDTVFLSVLLTNEGRKKSSSGSAIIDNLSDNISVLNIANSVKPLTRNEYDTIDFQLVITNSNANNISFEVTYLAGDYQTIKTYNILLKEETETFENGFTVLNWQNDEDNPWFIDSTTCYNGEKSARSKKNLADNKKSRLNLIVNNDVSSKISFYAKVSCEQDYDNFRFYIDNQPKLTLTFGYDNNLMEIPFKKYTFDLGSGLHTLCFSYEKDQSTSYGDDCAWIDNVVLSSGSDSAIFSLIDLLQDDVVLYPNPADKEIYLNNLPAKSGIIIADNNARVIYRNDASKENNIIDVSFLENGIYYIIVRQKDKIFTKKKLIIAR